MGYIIVKNITFSLLIASFVLFCGGINFGSMVMSGSAHASVSDSHVQLMPCCSIQTQTAQMSHNYSVANKALRVFFEVLAVGSAAFVVLSFILKFNQKTFFDIGARVLLYSHIFRDRFGSWRAFELFTKLFSFGILHPKTW